jgi:hypothetical protein
MKKMFNSVLVASAITFLPAIPLKADLSVALVINETGEDITLECGNYSLKIPAGQKRQPLRVAVPLVADYSHSMLSVGTESTRVYVWREGANLVSKDMYSTSIVLRNMDIAHSAGLLIRVTPAGVIFRLLADFEKSSIDTIYA